MSSETVPKLFHPIKVGNLSLQHRVVLAPLTRFRSDEKHVPLSHVPEYYDQRSRIPGSLLITEATFIHAKAGGYPNAPGIWSDDQIAAWKKVTDRVHANGSYIYLQLWAIGRQAMHEVLKKEDPSLEYTAPSAIGLAEYGLPNPRPLTIDEIHEFIRYYATAADNAVNKAGFDGVEIHGANGYLIDQFLQDVSNKRTDEYGGNIEKRARFALEVVDAVTKVVGEKRTGLRLSPWGTYGDMRMKEPKPQFAYLVEKLVELHPDLAYLHVVEPRADGLQSVKVVPEGFENDFIRKIWKPRPFISAGGHNRDTAVEYAEKNDDLIAIGRSYIANPDLPYRLRYNIPLTKGDRSLYYAYGSTDPHGYTDYPFAKDQYPELCPKEN
ncbi:hypothetical protein VNI00_011493 [Paramarasmius palmivorus]|uniref:NADH:flavin oxidoreductase/NADH oxidase N-terminal domain-containing protein n=1 Tax=Paramarasmius palmivorus TaxID=297713 RepID=A0AAW0CCX7_9AGAR